MTQIVSTQCDSCGGVITDPADLPTFWVTGRVNAGIRLDVCQKCYDSVTVERIVASAKMRKIIE